MNQIIEIKSSVGYRIFFSILICLSLALFIASVFLTFQHEDIPQKQVPFIYIGVALSLWMLIYLIRFITGTKITFKNEVIAIKNWKNNFTNMAIENKSILCEIKFPTSKIEEVRITEIKYAVYGSLNYIKKTCNQKGDNEFSKALNRFRRQASEINGFAKLGISVNKYIYIHKIDNNYIIVDTKLFSTNKVKLFLDKLVIFGINIIAQI